jgi:hypothetical protein
VGKIAGSEGALKAISRGRLGGFVHVDETGCGGAPGASGTIVRQSPRADRYGLGFGARPVAGSLSRRGG